MPRKKKNPTEQIKLTVSKAEKDIIEADAKAYGRDLSPHILRSYFEYRTLISFKKSQKGK